MPTHLDFFSRIRRPVPAAINLAAILAAPVPDHLVGVAEGID
jgi:hypothetical protein